MPFKAKQESRVYLHISPFSFPSRPSRLRQHEHFLIANLAVIIMKFTLWKSLCSYQIIFISSTRTLSDRTTSTMSRDEELLAFVARERHTCSADHFASSAYHALRFSADEILAEISAITWRRQIKSRRMANKFLLERSRGGKVRLFSWMLTIH